MASDQEQILVDSVRKFGIDILIQLTERLVAADKKASARLINSLNYDLQVALPVIFLHITGENYFKYIQDGSKPHYPKLDLIKLWCTFKGIDLKQAYPIQQSIGKFGIAPTDILTPILNDLQLDWKKEIEKTYRVWIEGRIQDIIKKAA